MLMNGPAARSDRTRSEAMLRYDMGAPVNPSPPTDLVGRTIGVTAERRAHQQLRYLQARGATTLWAPVLHTVDASERPQLTEVARSLIARPPEVLVVQTGQGLRWWLEALPDDVRDQLIASLSSTEVWCRGAKASSAARGAGLTVAWQAPNESAADLANQLVNTELAGCHVVVQLDGNDDLGLLHTAEAQGATALGLDVYRYRLPDDLCPAADLIAQVITGAVDAVTFTASPQIRHLRQIANVSGQLDQLDRAFTGTCLASVVGPVCAETARSVGWVNIIEPPTARLLPMLESLRSALTSDSSR